MNGQGDNDAFDLHRSCKVIVHDSSFIEIANEANACGRYEWRQIQGLGLGGSENLG
jgi:hypothetical protein